MSERNGARHAGARESAREDAGDGAGETGAQHTRRPPPDRAERSPETADPFPAPTPNRSPAQSPDRPPRIVALGPEASVEALAAALPAEPGAAVDLLWAADAGQARRAVTEAPVDLLVVGGVLGPYAARMLVEDLRRQAADRTLAAIVIAPSVPGQPRCAEAEASAPNPWTDLDEGIEAIDAADATPGLLRHVVRHALAHRRLARRLERAAQEDPLTGLPNRNCLRTTLARETARARRGGGAFALLFVDIDHFRRVNDGLGHDIGDLLLRVAGQRMRRAVREEDMVAHLGGDEFAILARQDGDDPGLAVLARRVQTALAAPLSLAGHPVGISVSIGICLCPRDGDDGHALMQHADVALLRAKTDGRNAVRYFDETMNGDVRDRSALSVALPGALARGELQLHYQPRLEAASGRVLGAEALLRWHHPQRGVIAPEAFIALAEASGDILPIGAWVTRRAAEACAGWRADGLGDLSVSVNLSPVQLADPGFVQVVRRILADTGLPPAALELEISETVAMGHAGDSESVLKGLTGLGVRLSIDDFGTGLSSLARLPTLPVHGLKIDGSIIRLLDRGETGTPIVDAVVALARQMQLSVVGEGVETARACALLAARGCDEVQGFHHCRPLPEAAFLSWLANREAAAASEADLDGDSGGDGRPGGRAAPTAAVA